MVDAVGQGRKQLYEGKEYDYVFDVDIAEGAPPLKMPYNVTGERSFSWRSGSIINCGTENPYSAAQRFLERNDLPTAHLDTVVQFIEKNTAGVNIGTGDEEYVDPYTGKLPPFHYFVHSIVFKGLHAIGHSRPLFQRRPHPDPRPHPLVLL